MMRASRPFAALLGGLSVWLVLAAGTRAADLVAIPPLEARVTDLTGTLTAEQRATLEQSLAEFEARKGSQIAVLLVPTTRPEAIEQYSIRVADQWKVGRKNVDDGLIIVVAKDDHKVRIEVGYGLEGPIPDVVARRVIRETIAPHFVEGDFYGGLRAATEQLMKLIDGEQLPPPQSAPGGGQRPDLQALFAIALVVIVVAGSVLTKVLGRFVGSAATGGVAGFIVKLLAGSLAAGLVAGLFAFLLALVLGPVGGGLAGGRRGGRGGGPWIGGGGGWSGGGWSGGGGGWSGGGGGFGGGGASGSW